ncbi:MAG: hypothetical protein R3E91_04895 [Chlamydiales bacterium]
MQNQQNGLFPDGLFPDGLFSDGLFSEQKNPLVVVLRIVHGIALLILASLGAARLLVSFGPIGPGPIIGSCVILYGISDFVAELANDKRRNTRLLMTVLAYAVIGGLGIAGVINAVQLSWVILGLAIGATGVLCLVLPVMYVKKRNRILRS